MAIWQTSRFKLDLTRPQVMGIVNVTPDSFSDGGTHDTPVSALKHAEQLLKEGADILDIGGESTRPGIAAVSLEDELARVMPVVQEAVKLGVPVSVDTYKPEVMQAVLDAGADIINDIWGLRMPGAEAVVAAHPNCGVCVMHMHGEPQTMQLTPMAGDVVPVVSQFLFERACSLMQQGISYERIVLDYGIGFGKTVEQNFALLTHQQDILALGFPLLAGWSRKSSLGAVTGRDVTQRTAASIAVATLAVAQGARIVRVHDVAATVDAIKVCCAVTHGGQSCVV